MTREESQSWPAFVQRIAEVVDMPLDQDSGGFQPFRAGQIDSLAISELVVVLLDDYDLDLLGRDAASARETTTLAELHGAAIAASPV